MGGVRRDTAQDDVIFKTILQDLKGLMRPEAVANQNTWSLLRPSFSLRVEHTFEPLHADLGVGVSRFGARIMPSRGGVCGPVASMGCGWPDDHWEERPTVGGYILDCSHHRPLNTRASVISWVVLTYQDLDGTEHA
jgi:hypothetical protein